MTTTDPEPATWKHWTLTFITLATLVAMSWALTVLPLPIAAVLALLVAAALVTVERILARSTL